MKEVTLAKKTLRCKFFWAYHHNQQLDYAVGYTGNSDNAVSVYQFIHMGCTEFNMIVVVVVAI